MQPLRIGLAKAPEGVGQVEGQGAPGLEHGASEGLAIAAGGREA
jgi:hypothetical protein